MDKPRKRLAPATAAGNESNSAGDATAFVDLGTLAPSNGGVEPGGWSSRATTWRRRRAAVSAPLMFVPEARVRVFVHGRPVDVRKSFTGLIALTKNALGQDPLSGHLYTFINRRGDYLKGFCCVSRRPIDFGKLRWHRVALQGFR